MSSEDCGGSESEESSTSTTHRTEMIAVYLQHQQFFVDKKHRTAFRQQFLYRKSRKIDHFEISKLAYSWQIKKRYPGHQTHCIVI